MSKEQVCPECKNTNGEHLVRCSRETPKAWKEKVHVLTADGTLLYNKLWDDGGPILFFDSGYGFVTRDDIKQCHWTIEKEWV